jgi:hypothetical protein
MHMTNLKIRQLFHTNKLLYTFPDYVISDIETSLHICTAYSRRFTFNKSKHDACVNSREMYEIGLRYIKHVRMEFYTTARNWFHSIPHRSTFQERILHYKIFGA